MDAPHTDIPPARDVRALVEALAAQLTADAQISSYNVETGEWDAMTVARAHARHARLLELAIEVGIAARQAPLPEDARAALRAVLQEEDHLRRMLWDGLWQGLGDYRYSDGFFFGGPHWPSVLSLCSAVVFLDELAGLACATDARDFKEEMSYLATELYEPSELRVPPGMPDDHWWWFRWTPEPLPRRASGA